MAGAVFLAAMTVPVTAPPRAALVGHGGTIRGIAVAPDGRRAITASFDYSLIVWDLETGKAAARLYGHDAALNAAVFLPDGRRAVSASDDGTLVLWDLDRGRMIRRFVGHTAKVAAVAVSPDGRLAASGGWDRTVRLWNLDTGRPGPVMLGHADNVNAVAFSADGKRVVSASYDGSIRVWAVADGAQLMEMPAQGIGANALIAMAGGIGIATVSSDWEIRLRDLATGRELGLYLGQEGPVLSVAMSADGRYLATGGLDGIVRLWRGDGGGGIVRRLEGHKGPVWSLAFLPDGGRLISAGADEVARIWDVARGVELGASATASRPAGAALDASAPGARLFRKCAACHTLGPDGGYRAGPSLRGLFGRRAGSVAGYPYSEALRTSGLVWTEETVNELFEIGPQALTPGSKMPLQRMPDARDRAELIEFLKRVTVAPDGLGERRPAAAD